jgi:hypothetical protein
MSPRRLRNGTHLFPLAHALRVVRNQCLCREANDVIAEEGGQFLCECSNESCHAVLSTSPEEYDAIRVMPTWFIVAPDHYDTLVERVVESRPGYDLIEKFGEGGLAAIRLDRRVRRAGTSAAALVDAHPRR